MNRSLWMGFYAVGLMVLTLILYGQSLDYPWAFDDHDYILKNPYLGDWSNFLKLFTHFSELATGAHRFGVDGDVSTNFVVRPLTYLTLQLNRDLGGNNPSGYRIFNIGLHFCNSLLVAFLIRSLLRTPRGLTFNCHVDMSAALAGCVFLVHPLQIESVTYVVQRSTSLCALFYLLCIVLHLAHLRSPGDGPWRAWLASVCALAAMLSKESGVTAPLAAWGLGHIAFGGSFLSHLWRARRLFVWLPVVPGLVLGASYCQRGGIDFAAAWSVASANKNSLYVWSYAATQPEVWWRYWYSFFWPTALCIDPALEVVADLSSSRFWSAFSAWIGTCAALLFLMRRPSGHRFAATMALSLGWFWLTIAPDSSIVPLPDAMADHRTYLPLVGACGMVGVVAGGSLLPRWPKPMSVAVSLSIVGLSISTFISQQKWSSGSRLWADACQKNSRNVRAWLNFGSSALDDGEIGQAVRAFEKSIEIRPTAVAYANLVVAEIRGGRFESALKYGLEGLKCPSSGYDYFILGALGEAYARLGRWSDAVAPLEMSYKLRSSYAPVVWTLASAYHRTNQLERASVVLQQGLIDHPGMEPFLALLRQVDEARDRVKSPQTASQDQREAPSFRLQLGFQ